MNVAGGAGSASGLAVSNVAVESCADAVSDTQNNAVHRIKNLHIRMTLLASQAATAMAKLYSPCPETRVHANSRRRFSASQYSASLENVSAVLVRLLTVRLCPCWRPTT